MDKLNLTELAAEINQNNRDKGFYEDGDDLLEIIGQSSRPDLVPALKSMQFAQRIALISSEASEALEGDRKGRTRPASNAAGIVMGMDNDAQFELTFQGSIKDTPDDELADVIIRVLDTCGELGIDIHAHVLAKLRYNKLRAYRHGKNY